MKAIPGQILDVYIQAGYPRDFLFNLFVEKVVMQRTDDSCKIESDNKKYDPQRCEFVFSNYVLEDIQIDLFQALGDYLLALGLTTESTKDTPTVPFEHPASINVRFVGNPPADKPHEAEVLGAPGGPGTDALAVSTSYQLCFEPLTVSDVRLVEKSLCGEKPNPKKKAAAGLPSQNQPLNPSGSATLALTVSDKFIDRLIQIAISDHRHDVAESLKSFRDDKPVKIKITVYTRHTEGMIYYLGELVRRQFAEENPRVIFVKEDKAYTRHDTKTPWQEAKEGCAPIFRLHQGPTPEPGALVSVFYDGRYFSLPAPRPPPLDRSSLAFDFLKQQMALNSSAKALPQSSVITAVGAP